MIDLTGIRVTTISATYGRKLNLTNYNSAEVSETVWADVAEGVDPQEASRKLFLIAKAMVREQAMPMIQGFKQQMQRIVDTLSDEDAKKLQWCFEEPSLELLLGREEEK